MPEQQICKVLARGAKDIMPALKALVDPKFNEDDVTVLLLSRLAAHGSLASCEPLASASRIQI